MIKRLFKHPLFYLLLLSFLMTSLPFVRYPLTDGDIEHWLYVAKDIRLHNTFLTSANDQGHGPLLGWTAGILSKPFPNQLYVYNLFNLGCGLLGLVVMYLTAQRIWGKREAQLSTFLFSTSLVFVYLSRTPMYDWPTAIFYFIFGMLYLLYKLEHKRRYYVLGITSLAIASLARFSIAMGLGLCFMALINLIFEKGFWKSLKSSTQDALMIVLGCILVNAPWVYGQIQAHGHDFLSIFLYDNFGRYIKEPGQQAVVRHDYYGFLAYVLIGILPYTFAFLATLFQKGLWSRIKNNQHQLAMMAGFLPCLIAFSFSGHVKLARYIAYVFPFLFMFMAYEWVHFDLKNPKWRKKCAIMTLVMAVILALLLASQAMLFSKEAKDALLMVFGIIGLVFFLLFYSFYIFTKRYERLLESPYTLLFPYTIAYTGFFLILSFEYSRAGFLITVQNLLMRAIQ
ncbi:MAG: ArnT family glycosyltransferase [Candidatus Margulisiibacteriota bacterium]